LLTDVDYGVNAVRNISGLVTPNTLGQPGLACLGNCNIIKTISSWMLRKQGRQSTALSTSLARELLWSYLVLRGWEIARKLFTQMSI
jgi:hypothetical protein